MKDYTLSEIKAHCKARVANKYQNPCNGCEMEVVCKSTLPVGWDIEPRDMIELPCKTPANAEPWQISPYKWQVIWRGSYKICTCEFHTEEEADAFLANMKGGKA